MQELTSKSEELTNICIIKETELKSKKEKILKNREKKVANAVQTNIEKKEKEELLLKYNKKEINNEKKLIENQVDKMHSLYEIGLKLAEKLKNLTLEELKKKMDKAPSFSKGALNSQIEALNQKSSEDFLNSDLGEPLKSALEKEGLKKEVLQGYMEDLKKERLNRRKEEREKYNIEKNEFPPDDEIQFTSDDLFDSLKDDYAEKFFPELKDLKESDDESDD